MRKLLLIITFFVAYSCSVFGQTKLDSIKSIGYQVGVYSVADLFETAEVNAQSFESARKVGSVGKVRFNTLKERDVFKLFPDLKWHQNEYSQRLFKSQNPNLYQKKLDTLNRIRYGFEIRPEIMEYNITRKRVYNKERKEIVIESTMQFCKSCELNNESYELYKEGNVDLGGEFFKEVKGVETNIFYRGKSLFGSTLYNKATTFKVVDSTKAAKIIDASVIKVVVLYNRLNKENGLSNFYKILLVDNMTKEILFEAGEEGYVKKVYNKLNYSEQDFFNDVQLTMNTSEGGVEEVSIGSSKLKKRTITLEVDSICKERGVQVVKVLVDREGYVIKAIGDQYGSTNFDACFTRDAECVALEYRYVEDFTAPKFRTGLLQIVRE